MTGDTIDPNRQLGDLVNDHPEFARVFESVGIDFCCGGNQTLEEACRTEGLDIDEVRSRLTESDQQDSDVEVDWDSTTDLVEHIVDTHHEFLRDELPELSALVQKVSEVHADNHPELREIEAEFLALAEEIQTHTEEEETEVFPVIEKLDRDERAIDDEVSILREAFDDLEADHEATAEHLERIAELSDEYAVPEDACPSYQRMLDRLEALERDVHIHVHKENNILFPAAESQLVANS